MKHRFLPLISSSHLLLILLLAYVSAGWNMPLFAQARYRTVTLGAAQPSFSSRLTWWTNLTDWALVAPNLGFEVDLLPPERMWGQSVSLQLRDGADSQYRLWHNDFDGSDLSVFSARIDYRWHFAFNRHPEYCRGRYFAGPYAEFVNREGYSSLGVLAGYDFPAFNYANRRYLQFQVSALASVFRESFMGELHLGMTLRNMSISSKYWQPDETVFVRNRVENQLIRQQLDTILAQVEAEPVVLSVPSLLGDSLLAQPITLSDVRTAFARRFNSSFLQPDYFEELPDNTPLPITLPSEFNNIRYRAVTKAEEYDGLPGELSYIFPFRVRIQGYEWAVARQQSYNDSLRAAYHHAGRQLPVLYLPPVSSDSMAVSATVDQVQDLLSAQWRADRLSSNEITDFYYRQDGEFVPVSISQLNRRGTYAVGLRFHPQVAEAYDSLSTRFNILPSIVQSDQEMYDRFIAVNSSRTFYVERPWRNGREEEVTKMDVIQALDDAGYPGYQPHQVLLPDSIRYGRNLGTTTYGPALRPLQFIFVVEDSVGLRQGTHVFNALTNGVDSRRATWNPRFAEHDVHGPLVDGVYDEATGELVVADRQALFSAVCDYLADINPALAGMHFDEAWVEDYQLTGRHPLGQRQPGDPVTQEWTILQFRYRMLYLDGRPRIATANVAYRIRKPQTLEQ